MPAAPLLVVRRLVVRYALPRRLPWQAKVWRHAVEGLDFNLEAGETLGIVGESGCGKSTLARALVGLEPIAGGAVLFNGQDLAGFDKKQWRAVRRDIQLVFQDPVASLDPRMAVGRILEQPLLALRPELDAVARAHRIASMLERVGLSSADLQRHPHEFSGGQCQRLGLARALVVEPKLLICDEPVSALDVSVQAQVINLLGELQRDLGLAMIFIAHDLAVVRQLAQRVLVLYAGNVMERATRDILFTRPLHPYTRSLLQAVPGSGTVADTEEAPPEGPVESVDGVTVGCRYRGRCSMVDDYCGRDMPALRKVGAEHFAACHYISSEGFPSTR